jgi:hypothetical protein
MHACTVAERKEKNNHKKIRGMHGLKGKFGLQRVLLLFLFAYFHGFNLSRIYSQLLSYQKSNATVDKYRHVCTLALFIQLLIALI